MSKKRPKAWTPKSIRDMREKLGLSVDQAAEKLGISPRQWFYFEAGTRKPSGPAAVLLDLMAAKKI